MRFRRYRRGIVGSRKINSGVQRDLSRDFVIIEFYGTECPHCIRMKPIVERLKSEGVEFQEFEVWHSDENARKMEEYDKGYCGGVPFFINSATNKWICGGTSYEELKALAEGK